MTTDNEEDSSAPEDVVQTTTNNASLERLLESSTRITLATFGGGVVGLALERQQQQQSPRTKRPRAPPVKGSQLSKTWAASCMFFALILESSRLASPTSSLLEFIGSDKEKDFKQEMQQKAFTTIGDYTIGGTVAGLAGAMAQRGPPGSENSDFRLKLPQTILQSGRRPLILWGLGMGMGLGVLAGLLQAGIDVGSLYLEKEQQEEEDRRQQEEGQDISPEPSTK